MSGYRRGILNTDGMSSTARRGLVGAAVLNARCENRFYLMSNTLADTHYAYAQTWCVVHDQPADQFQKYAYCLIGHDQFTVDPKCRIFVATVVVDEASPRIEMPPT